MSTGEKKKKVRRKSIMDARRRNDPVIMDIHVEAEMRQL